MARVMVTGASGFIGTTLREHFALNTTHAVIGVDRVRPLEHFAHTGNGEQIERCDLLDRERFTELVRWHKPDAIIHTAAQARVDPSLTDPLSTYDLNVEATLNIMHACQAAGVPHFVVCSSEAIYGRARAYPCIENNDFNPANPYAASKVAVDVMCQQFDRVVPTCVIRSGMGWGPRSNPKEQVVAKFIMKALNDDALKFPSGAVTHPTRDLNHVQDFAYGVNRVLANKARGVYNLSGGREYTVLEIAERIVKAVGRGRIEFTDEFTYREGEEGFRTWMDVTKAQHDLGHIPQNHLEGDVLDLTIGWYRNHMYRSRD